MRPLLRSALCALIAVCSLGLPGTTAAWMEIASSASLPDSSPINTAYLDAIGIADDGTVLLWSHQTFSGLRLWTWTRSGGLVRFEPDPVGALDPFTWLLHSSPVRVAADGRVALIDETHLYACHLAEPTCTVVASIGDAVAGLPDATIAHFGDFAFLGDGRVAFLVQLEREAGTSTSALVASGDPAPTLVLASGDPTPGAPDETLDAPFSDLAGCGTGLALVTALVPPPTPVPPWLPDELVRFTPQAGLSAPLVPGAPVPDGPDAWKFGGLATARRRTDLPPFACDAAANVAFLTTTSDPSAAEPDMLTALWTCAADGACALRALEGDAAPGPDGTTFVGLDLPFGGFVLDSDGTLFFEASTQTLQGMEPPVLLDGIFASAESGAVTSRVRDGDRGALPNATLDDLALVAAANGRILFRARESSSTWAAKRGVYASEPDGSLRALYLHDEVTTGPFPYPFRFVSVAATDSALEHAVLHTGETSGFVSTSKLLYASAPEPTDAASGAVALAAALALRRRRRGSAAK